MQNRLNKKFVIMVIGFIFMFGTMGAFNPAYANDETSITLGACNGSGLTENPNGGDAPVAPSCLSQDDDGNYSFNSGADGGTCSINEDGELESADFEDLCEKVATGTTVDEAISAMASACDGASDDVKDNCRTAAFNMKSALASCRGGVPDKVENKTVWNSAMYYFCNAACNIEAAAEEGDKKSAFAKLLEKGWELVKTVGTIIIDTFEHIANMATCLFGGETDVETDPIRTSFAKVVWFAPIIRSLLTGINVVAYDTRDVVIKYAQTLLGLGLAFWLLFRIMRMAASQKNVDLESFLTDIGKAFVRCIVVVGLLTCYSKGIFDLFLIPVAESFSVGTTMIVDNVGTDGDGEAMCGESAATAKKSVEDIMNDADLPNRIEAMLPTPTAAQDGDDNIVIKLGRPIVTAIANVNTRLMILMADGWAMVKWGNENPVLMCLIPNLYAIFYGFIFMFFAGVLAIKIPLKYIDALIKMGIAICLTPFFLTAWAFPSTRKYTMKGLNLFMHTFILVLVMSIVAVICLISIEVATGNFIGCGQANEIMELIKIDDESKNPFMTLMTTMVLIIACMKMIKAAPEVAQNISGASGGTDIGDNLERMITKVASKGGQAALGAANLAGRGIASTAKSGKDAFMSTQAGQDLANKISSSKLVQTAGKVGGYVSAPFKGAKAYLDDRRDYKLAKKADKGFVNSMLLGQILGKDFSDEARERLNGTKGVKAAIVRGLVNKTHDPISPKNEEKQKADEVVDKSKSENKDTAEKKSDEAKDKANISREQIVAGKVGTAAYIAAKGKPKLSASMKAAFKDVRGAKADGTPAESAKDGSLAGADAKPEAVAEATKPENAGTAQTEAKTAPQDEVKTADADAKPEVATEASKTENAETAQEDGKSSDTEGQKPATETAKADNTDDSNKKDEG